MYTDNVLKLSCLASVIFLMSKDKLILNTPVYIQDIVELVDHNEWGVAYELLCSEIYEYELHITREQYQILEKIGKKLKIDKCYYIDIAYLIKV